MTLLTARLHITYVQSFSHILVFESHLFGRVLVSRKHNMLCVGPNKRSPQLHFVGQTVICLFC